MSTKRLQHRLKQAARDIEVNWSDALSMLLDIWAARMHFQRTIERTERSEYKRMNATINRQIFLVFQIKLKNLFPIAQCIQIACLIRFQGISYHHLVYECAVCCVHQYIYIYSNLHAGLKSAVFLVRWEFTVHQSAAE